MLTTNTLKPAHHKPSHSIKTKRLHIRSPILSDAQAIYNLRSSPANCPYESVEPDISPQTYEKRIPRWTSGCEKGECAFMVFILPFDSTADDLNTIAAENLAVHDGKLIGFGGVNVFSREKPTAESTEEVLVVDTGAMIDHRYWRQGLGIEAVAATVDYAFDVLECGMVLIETDLDNMPWRAMMNRKLGLGEREVKQFEPDTEEEYVAWRFNREAWAEAKGKTLEAEKST